jgi:hypothetical protein
MYTYTYQSIYVYKVKIIKGEQSCHRIDMSNRKEQKKMNERERRMGIN